MLISVPFALYFDKLMATYSQTSTNSQILVWLYQNVTDSWAQQQFPRWTEITSHKVVVARCTRYNIIW